ncbi:glycerophosphodiester phosphodiesterase family protein [Pseudoruegeria sp. SK021]|uniref:glycerophosphodiester phosphodiesterase family protein n=1 Tax=Pseudoruegeria sp. SK021 TaxID=1933035 RepID=UPI000A24B089|nr:glycerophosphodiester phosphodiesterase family protein [Pseudoruegeria sp. SK021]OSP54318.1 glycerophosphodiester phosphodiesterase [Pseudoruegeria sp. SK021]
MTFHRTLVSASALALVATTALADVVTMGPRPYYLIDKMTDGPLKDKLLSCAEGPFTRSDFSIGHRGAQMQFPEHTVEANVAAARMGAGILECDVTFTKDKELVCRHAQNDLHTTTNILATDLAETCVTPFSPASGDDKATAECRTSEVTLDEFMTLTPKMDAASSVATTVEAYMDSTAGWRTDLYAVEPTTLMTHAESIELFKSLGAKFTPELKGPSVEMPFDGFTQEDYAQKLVDEYKAAGIPASDVFLQSFNLDDVLYWIKAEPEFGAQAVYLVEGHENYDNMDPESWDLTPAEIKAMGVNYLAPALWMMVTLDADNKIVPSEYAIAAKEADLKLIAWSLERSGPLTTGGGWYYQSIAPAITSDGMMYELVDVLAQDVGVEGIFTDWNSTVTYYANCMGL